MTKRRHGSGGNSNKKSRSLSVGDVNNVLYAILIILAELSTSSVEINRKSDIYGF